MSATNERSAERRRHKRAREVARSIERQARLAKFLVPSHDPADPQDVNVVDSRRVLFRVPTPLGQRFVNIGYFHALPFSDVAAESSTSIVRFFVAIPYSPVVSPPARRCAPTDPDSVGTRRRGAMVCRIGSARCSAGMSAVAAVSGPATMRTSGCAGSM